MNKIIKKTSNLKKSLAVALSVATLSVAAMPVSQAAMTNTAMTETVAAAQSNISLDQAMTLANKTVAGDIVSVGFDQEDRMENNHYEISIIANNNEQDIIVNANTGKVIKDEIERLDREDMAEYNTMKQAKISLSQAINSANQTLNGTVLEAEFDIEADKPVYKVEIGSGNQVHDVMVDSMTGKVLSSHVDHDA